MKRAAIYTRVSNKNQEDGVSLDDQKRLCYLRAAELQATVKDEHFFRETFTAVEYQRPEFDRLRWSIENDELDVIIVYDILRLSREPSHLMTVLKIASDHGAVFEFINNEIPKGDDGELLAFIMGWQGKREYKYIKQRIEMGKQGRRDKGWATVSPRPRYGYCYKGVKKEKYEVDESPIPGWVGADQLTRPAVIRMIFKWASEGMPALQITRRINAMGLPTPTGKEGAQWAVTTVCAIIKDPQYIGKYAFMRTQYERQGGKWLGKRTPEDQLVYLDDIVPAIVTEEVWLAANKMLAVGRQRSAKRLANPEDFLLRGGIVRCGYCGSSAHAGRQSLNAKTRKRGLEHGVGCYRCTTLNRDKFGCPSWSITSHILDEAVWKHVREVLKNPDIIAREVKALRANACDPTIETLAVVERQLVDLAKERSVLERKWAMETDETFIRVLRDQLTMQGEKVRELEGLRDEMQLKQGAWEQSQSKLWDFYGWARKLGELLDGDQLTYAQKRMAVEMLGVEVKLWATGHDPRWEITMTLEGVVPLSFVESARNSRGAAKIQEASENARLVLPLMNPSENKTHAGLPSGDSVAPTNPSSRLARPLRRPIIGLRFRWTNSSLEYTTDLC